MNFFLFHLLICRKVVWYYRSTHRPRYKRDYLVRIARTGGWKRWLRSGYQYGYPQRLQLAGQPGRDKLRGGASPRASRDVGEPGEVQYRVPTVEPGVGLRYPPKGSGVPVGGARAGAQELQHKEDHRRRVKAVGHHAYPEVSQVRFKS